MSFLHGPITDIREVSLYLGDEDSFRLKEGERPNFSILILTFDPSILFKPHLTTWGKTCLGRIFMSHSFSLRMVAGFFISRENLWSGYRFHHMPDATIYWND